MKHEICTRKEKLQSCEYWVFFHLLPGIVQNEQLNIRRQWAWSCKAVVRLKRVKEKAPSCFYQVDKCKIYKEIKSVNYDFLTVHLFCFSPLKSQAEIEREGAVVRPFCCLAGQEMWRKKKSGKKKRSRSPSLPPAAMVQFCLYIVHSPNMAKVQNLGFLIQV